MKNLILSNPRYKEWLQMEDCSSMFGKKIFGCYKTIKTFLLLTKFEVTKILLLSIAIK